MSIATITWPDVPAEWDPLGPAEDDWFVLDCTEKLSERVNDFVVGTPDLEAFLPAAPTVPVSDLTFSNVTVQPNPAGLAAQIVSFQITCATNLALGQTYKVSMTFQTASGRSLVRSQLLTVSSR